MLQHLCTVILAISFLMIKIHCLTFTRIRNITIPDSCQLGEFHDVNVGFYVTRIRTVVMEYISKMVYARQGNAWNLTKQLAENSIPIVHVRQGMNTWLDDVINWSKNRRT